MKILDLSTPELQVKIAGQNYTVRYPTLDEIEVMSKNPDANDMTLVKKLLTDLGIPADVVGKIPAPKFQELVVALTQPDLKKS